VGKPVGPDSIYMKIWTCLSEKGLNLMTRLFNVIFRRAKMLYEWRFSTIIPLCKNSCNIQNSSNYSGTKLLSHIMKWERLIERRLRKHIRIIETQFGFMRGRSTMKLFFSYGVLWSFIGIEKRTATWCSLTERKLMIEYIWKCFGGAYKRKACRLSIFKLSKIRTTRWGHELGS